MVTLEGLREYMKKQAEADRLKKSVQVTGRTIEQCLEQASIEIGLPVTGIEYEVLEKGGMGFLGMGKKDFILIAYPLVEESEIESFEDGFGFDFGITNESDVPLDVDGEVFVRMAPEGVLLRAIPPKGKGKRATKKNALDILKKRGVFNYDDLMVSSVIKETDGVYVKVGDFQYNPVNDSVMVVDIVDFEMAAMIVIQPPGPGGADLSVETMISFLKNNSVVHGIKENVLKSLQDQPVYNEPILVAEGSKPVNGDDAKVIYNFETEANKIKIKEVDGKVDFKEMNRIQNVVEGQILAKKIPEKQGVDGRTVTGRLLPSKSGNTVELGAGKNVKISSDGLTLIASCNGQALLLNNKVNVEPVYVIEGDVNMKVGNIVHLGTVIIKGNVEDGFKVKASGNIEVTGTVGKCELDAEGDIIVRQGITGKSEGMIKAGKTVWSKFIENAVVEVGENVVASDGIINSKVDANRKIVCLGRGKRAKIVGGHLRATEEIIAETFGSTAGAETVLEVGYDPKSKARLAQLEDTLSATISSLEEINLNITTLAKMKKLKKNLSEEKDQYLKEIIEKRGEHESEITSLKAEIETIHEYLAALKFKGKISASKQVFPGVKIYIKDAMLEIRNEFKAVTFLNDDNIVKVTKYEQPAEDFSRR